MFPPHFAAWLCSRWVFSHRWPQQYRQTPSLHNRSERPLPISLCWMQKGKPSRSPAYKGKIVLLDFWATYCGGCKVEIPWYVEFDKKYRNQGLAVIGVSMDEQGMKIVKPFLAQKRIDYPVVIGNDKLAARYNLTAMPMTLLIDRDGKIALSHTGLVDKADFENHIQQLLK